MKSPNALRTIFRLLRDTAVRYPSALAGCSAQSIFISRRQEIAVIGMRDAADTQALLREIWRRYLPNRAIAQAAAGDTLAA